MQMTVCCPAIERYQELLAGKVSVQDGEQLVSHLDQCERCAEAVKRLLATDTVVEMVRGKTLPGGEKPDPALENLMARLWRFKPVPAGGKAAHGSPTVPPPAPAPAGGATTDLGEGEARPESKHDYADLLAPAQGPDELGRLGPYRVLKVLGAGGMGVVFQAEDPQLQRPVALKAMLPALAARPIAHQRFLREARAAAAVKNDHVVAIYQVGDDRGVPFLAMEFLEGETLDDRLRREGKLSPAEVIRVGREMADGLAAAHTRGLIHRDIKPANVWLEGKRSRVKILDFGLARAAEESAHLTQQGVIVGTPAFMAPEQAKGQKVDERGDLFSLGCLLYLAAVGKLAFDGTDTISTLLAVASHHPKAPSLMNSQLPQALSDLILKLLAKDPAQRYQTAAEVTQALESFAPSAEMVSSSTVRPFPTPTVSGPRLPPSSKDSVAALGAEAKTVSPSREVRPISTTSITSSSRLKALVEARSSRRRKYAIVAGAVVVVLGLAGVLFGPSLYRIATNQGQLVMDIEGAAVDKILAQQPLRIGERGGTRTFTLKPGPQTLPAGRYEMRGGAPPELRFSTRDITIARNGSASLKVTLEPAVADRPTSENLGQLAVATGPVPLDRLEREQIPAFELAMAGGGDPKQAPPGLVAVWGDSRLKHQGPVYGVAYSPDGKTLASGSWDRTVKLWNPETGQGLRTLKAGDLVSCVAFNPKGTLLACGCENGTIKVWDPAGGSEIQTLRGHKGGVRSVAFREDGLVLASGSLDHTVKLWDTGTWKERKTLPGHQKMVSSVAFSPDRKLLASGSDDNTIRLWDPVSGQDRGILMGHKGSVRGIAFSSDSKRLASASADGTVKLWDTEMRKEKQTFSSESPDSVAFSPDGKTLACGDGSGPVLLWDLTSGKQPRPLSGHKGDVHSLAFRPDGKTLASGSHDNTIKLWDLSTGQEQLTPKGHAGSVASVSFSPDGKVLASGSNDQTVKLWDSATGKELLTLIGSGGSVLAVALSPDGETVAAGGLDRTIRLWSRTSGKELGSLPKQPQGILSLAFSPDGKLLASGSWDGKVVVWQVDQRKEVYNLKTNHKDGFTAVVFSPDSKLLASGGAEGTVQLWEMSNGKEFHTLRGGEGGIKCLAFSPDSQVVAAGNESPTVKRWKAVSGSPLPSLIGQQSTIKSIAFSPDRQLLAAAADDGTVRFWELASSNEKAMIPLYPAGGMEDRGNPVAFSPEVRHLASGNGNGTISIYRLAPLAEKK